MQLWCQPCFSNDGLRSLSERILREVRSYFHMYLLYMYFNTGFVLRFHLLSAGTTVN